MASVKSVETYSDVPWVGGRRKRRYRITLTDNDSADVVFITRPFKQQVADDGTAIADRALAAFAENEKIRFASNIRNDIPADFMANKWNTRADLFRYVLRQAFLADHREDPLPYNFGPYLDQVTDQQLINLTGKNQAWVDVVRQKRSKLEAIKTELDGYSPEDLD